MVHLLLSHKKVAIELKGIFTAPSVETALATRAEVDASTLGAKYPQTVAT